MLLSGLVLVIGLSVHAQQATAPVPLYNLLHKGSNTSAPDDAAVRRAMEEARKQVFELQAAIAAQTGRSPTSFAPNQAQPAKAPPAPHSEKPLAPPAETPDGTTYFSLDHGAPTPTAAPAPTAGNEQVSPELEQVTRQLQQQSAQMQEALKEFKALDNEQ